MPDTMTGLSTERKSRRTPANFNGQDDPIKRYESLEVTEMAQFASPLISPAVRDLVLED